MSSPAHLRVIDGSLPGDALLGQTVDGRYLVERVLGEGGMGLVYRAKHVVLGKPLAMKVLRHDVSRDEEIITRFRQEAQSASSIGNQHIIDISDFGVLRDGSTYFIMEYLDGQELTKAIEREAPLSFQRIAHVTKQLCDALGAAHAGGIVHRDLKPDNVYLIKRGQDTSFVKVLDFGIAKVGGSTSKLTRAGQVFGTPHYMSPEQCAGASVDQRTDIYAIGIMLYEMVTGRVPFDADNLMGILSKHLYEEPARPSQLRADCPPAFEAVILRCIAKQPEARYQTCAELADDIARLEAGMAPMAVSMPRAPTMPAIAAEKPRTKRPLVLAVVTLAVLGLGGAGAFVLSQQSAAREAELARALEAQQRQQSEALAAHLAEQQRLAERNVAAVAKIRLVTDPVGAEVYRGDELVGTTPVEIPRPTERLELELRHPGYDTRRAILSNLTSGEVSFVLSPTTATGESRGGEGRARAPRDDARPETGMTPTPVPAGGGNPDILNPWGDH